MKARALSLSLLACFGLSAVADAAEATGAAAVATLSAQSHAGCKLLIDEIEVSFGDAASAAKLGSTYTAHVRAAAERAIRAAIGHRVPIVTETGPGVVRLRAAITDVRVVERRETWRAYSPIGFMVQQIDVVSRRDFRLVAATVKLELIDGRSGRSLRGVADLTAADAPPGTNQAPALHFALKRLTGWTRHYVWWLGRRPSIA